MAIRVEDLRETLEQYGQEHVLRFWDNLTAEERGVLQESVATVDFPLMARLIDEWIHNEPSAEHFSCIDPVDVIPEPDMSHGDTVEAFETGEVRLAEGRVGVIMVAGGQGTRLGFDGPKGAYPVGSITGKSLFQYHAEKILNLERRYRCIVPWYIMVSGANEAATREFFEANQYFGLGRENVYFFQQDMVPCVDEHGRFMLEEPCRLAKSPNGHGGCIPALAERGVIADCHARGIDTLTYFQVDNWAVQVADPVFIGYHVRQGSEMSSKVRRKTELREPVGVHCLCDGQYRLIEYSELDFYPQLLEVDARGNPVHFAGNPAMHVFSVPFIERVYANYQQFPWHRAHKKIPHVDSAGNYVRPDGPNGYKFETFIFDALQFVERAPVNLELRAMGEYTPIKQFEGAGSVLEARDHMRRHWGAWLVEAGAPVPKDAEGYPPFDVEISPAYALSKEEFVLKSHGRHWPAINGPIAIGAGGEISWAEANASA